MGKGEFYSLPVLALHPSVCRQRFYLILLVLPAFWLLQAVDLEESARACILSARDHGAVVTLVYSQE